MSNTGYPYHDVRRYVSSSFIWSSSELFLLQAHNAQCAVHSRTRCIAIASAVSLRFDMMYNIVYMAQYFIACCICNIYILNNG